MSAVIKNRFISVEAYLAGELNADTKHEYIEGDVYAMAGASKNHQSITDNVCGELRQHLKNTPCRPFGSDSKVKVGNQFFYPDVMVVCDDKTDNTYYTEAPILLVEVLSKSTRRTDETIKRVAYSSLPSVQEYVCVSRILLTWKYADALRVGYRIIIF
jgi:Uma2 family endonuclease